MPLLRPRRKATSQRRRNLPRTSANLPASGALPARGAAKKSAARKWWRSYLLYAPLAWLLVFVPVSRTGSAKRIDFFLLDRLTELRHSPDQRADPRLFFVG